LTCMELYIIISIEYFTLDLFCLCRLFPSHATDFKVCFLAFSLSTFGTDLH
jgi:hypothetical protein